VRQCRHQVAGVPIDAIPNGRAASSVPVSVHGGPPPAPLIASTTNVMDDADGCLTWTRQENSRADTNERHVRRQWHPRQLVSGSGSGDDLVGSGSRTRTRLASMQEAAAVATDAAAKAATHSPSVSAAACAGRMKRQ
jgi:hypothetical protein